MLFALTAGANYRVKHGLIWLDSSRMGAERRKMCSDITCCQKFNLPPVACKENTAFITQTVISISSRSDSWSAVFSQQCLESRSLFKSKCVSRRLQRCWDKKLNVKINTRWHLRTVRELLLWIKVRQMLQGLQRVKWIHVTFTVQYVLQMQRWYSTVHNNVHFRRTLCNSFTYSLILQVSVLCLKH